ncbi:hypothetical protein J6X15_02040 [Candidatus Saccharibacteria bacterium]|nr:hypothetical protein [Candidatus Saccharibacteria bacterium]
MNQDAPVSMIESSHEAQLAEAASTIKRRRSIAPLVVIGVSIGLLGILTVVLLVLVKNGGNAAGYRYLPDYKKTYKCATDEYNYHDGVFDIQIGFKEDGTYKNALSDDHYTLGTFKEMNQVYARSNDGANEINYYLSLKKEKTILNNKSNTEGAGEEETIILNINEKSDVIVLMSEDEEEVFYCVEK